MIKKIELILKAENLTTTQFADLLGVQRSTMSHILSGRNKPSLDFITKLLKVFPGIRYEWLILDQGTMYKQEKQNPSVVNSREIPPVLVEKNDLENPSRTYPSLFPELDLELKREREAQQAKEALEALENSQRESYINDDVEQESEVEYNTSFEAPGQGRSTSQGFPTLENTATLNQGPQRPETQAQFSQSPTYIEPIRPEVPQTGQQSPKTGENPATQAQEKTIEKIIIFYADKTFELYRP